MTAEEFAKKFGDFLAGTDTDRTLSADELALLQEVERLAQDPRGQAWMRQIIRQRPEILYPRTLSVETVADGLGVEPDYIISMVAAGRICGTLGQDGCWRFSADGIYSFLFPSEESA